MLRLGLSLCAQQFLPIGPIPPYPPMPSQAALDHMFIVVHEKNYPVPCITPLFDLLHQVVAE